MIPLGDLAVEVVLAVGGALFGANLWVLLRPKLTRPQDRRQLPKVPSKRRVYVNLVLGAAATAWALATLIARS